MSAARLPDRHTRCAYRMPGPSATHVRPHTATTVGHRASGRARILGNTRSFAESGTIRFPTGISIGCGGCRLTAAGRWGRADPPAGQCLVPGFRLFSDAYFSGCECARQNRACTYILYCQGAHMPGTTLTYSEERRRKRRRSTYSACAASERRKHRKFCGAFGATHGNDFRKCFYHKKCR